MTTGGSCIFWGGCGGSFGGGCRGAGLQEQLQAACRGSFWGVQG